MDCNQVRREYNLCKKDIRMVEGGWIIECIIKWINTILPKFYIETKVFNILCLNTKCVIWINEPASKAFVVFTYITLLI